MGEILQGLASNPLVVEPSSELLREVGLTNLMDFLMVPEPGSDGIKSWAEI